MSHVPSSQTKLKNKPDLQTQIRELQQRQARLKVQSMSLGGKMRLLRQTVSDDPLQQLQSDILMDMYTTIVEVNKLLDPLLLQLPDVGSVTGR